MNATITIIKSSLNQQGIHSDEIDFILKYLDRHEKLIQHAYEVSSS